MRVSVAEDAGGTARPGPIDYRSVAADPADLVTVAGTDGVYRYVSGASRRLFGWEPADLVGHQEDYFVHPHDLQGFHVARSALTTTDCVTTSYRFLCRNRSTCWTETTSRLVRVNDQDLVVSSVHDTSERHLNTSRLERQAFTDPLTGVANRPVLMDRLQRAILRLDRNDGVLAVLYLDLDRFKVVNDSLGHRVGDAVLLQMAERLLRHLRPTDTLARLGGDEFVIVAEGLPNEFEAVELGRRIIEACREPFQVAEEEFNCTVSVGIVCTRDSQRGSDDLLGEADLALYRAKDHGRDRSEIFDEDLRAKAVGRLVTEQMLRQALTEGNVVVEYQPIVDLSTGRTVAAEALVRVRDPLRGMQQPDSFMEVAEETGLLIEMDGRVLADAVAQESGWQLRLPAAHFEVAINVTARHLADSGFQKAVINQLDRHGVDPGDLQIEVTERVLLEASNSAITGLRDLRLAGVQVGLDDFGTGYSSLAYLRQFPLDFIKIDRSFLRELEAEEDGRAVVGAIIDLAHALHLTVVAEGVETEGQRRILRDLGCDRAQGFLFGASGTPEAIDRLVMAGSGVP